MQLVNGFLKKGRHSVGVGRQYSGTAGRIENSQIGVFACYASRFGHALIDRQLYLPKDWAADKARRKKAHVPEDIAFATKPAMARDMIARTLDAGLPCAWVLADALYGADSKVRRMLENRRQAYVLATRSNHTLRFLEDDGLIPACSRSAAKVGPAMPDPKALAYYFVHAPKGTSLADIAGAAGLRWTIEECFLRAKDDLGLDHCEARSWHGWHRPMTLVMAAAAFLAKLAADQRRQAFGKRIDAIPEAKAA